MFLSHFPLSRLREIPDSIPDLIEILIGRSDKVDDREKILAIIDSRPSSDDLLVLYDRADRSYEDDISDISRIDSCREHLRAREDRGSRLVIILKSLQISTTDLSLIRGDSDTVVRISTHLVTVDSISHTESMRLIHTEYYGLVHGSYLSEDRLGDEIRPLIDDDPSLIVRSRVDGSICDSTDDTISTRESQLVEIGMDTTDLEWCEKSIIDPSGERVLIDRSSEILIGIDIVPSLRSGSESDLYRLREIGEDLCPVTILSRSSSMTLIDDDEVKEIFLIPTIVRVEREGSIEISFLILHLISTRSTDESLIDREKNIRIGRDSSPSPPDLGSIDFQTVFFEWIEGIHCLIDEDIAVSEDEDPRTTDSDPISTPSSHEESIHDLKGYDRLARPGRQSEEDSLFLVCYSLHRPSDSDILIVSWLLSRDTGRFSQEYFFGDIFLGDRPMIELIRSRI